MTGPVPAESPDLGSRHRRPPVWLWGSANLVAVLVRYFAAPIHAGQGPARVVAGFVVTLLGVLVAAFIVLWETRRRRTGEQGLLAAPASW